MTCTTIIARGYPARVRLRLKKVYIIPLCSSDLSFQFIDERTVSLLIVTLFVPFWMEVAGLVFGALPLAITALQCFKTGRSLKDAVRNRERHVQRLVRALQGQRAILELYLVWLLKAVRAYDELYHTPHHIPFLLQDGETVSRIDSFLGRQASDAFQDAVIEAYEAVLQVMRGVEGLLPDGDNKVSLYRNTTAQVN